MNPRDMAAFGAVALQPSCTLVGVRAGAAATDCLCALEIGQSCGSGSAGEGKPQWFLALEQMATAHTRQDLTLAVCAATSPCSHSVAIYEP